MSPVLPYGVKAGSRAERRGRSWTFTFSCRTWPLEEGQGKAKGRSQAGTGRNVWLCVCVYTWRLGATCVCLESEGTHVDGSLYVSECVLFSCGCGGSGVGGLGNSLRLSMTWLPSLPLPLPSLRFSRPPLVQQGQAQLHGN